jgi:hypothetical protein
MPEKMRFAHVLQPLDEKPSVWRPRAMSFLPKGASAVSVGVKVFEIEGTCFHCGIGHIFLE